MENVIKVLVRDSDSLYNKFSNGELSDELGNFIMMSSFEKKLSRDIRVEMTTCFAVSDDDKDLINDMVHRYFGLSVKQMIYYIRFSIVKQLILFVLGIILIIMSVLMPGKVISEVLLISGWVCVWETVYGLFFIDTKYHVKMKRFRELSRCKVVVSESKE